MPEPPGGSPPYPPGGDRRGGYAVTDPNIGFTFAELQLEVAEFLGIAYYGSDGTSAAAVPSNAADLALVKRLVNKGYRRLLSSYPKWTCLQPEFDITLTTGFSGEVQVYGTTTSMQVENMPGATDAYIGWVLTFTTGASAGISKIITDSSTPNGVVWVGALSYSAGDGYIMAPAACAYGDPSKYWMPAGFAGHIHGSMTYGKYNQTSPGHAITIVSQEELRRLYQVGLVTGDPRLGALVRPTSATERRWYLHLWPRPSSANIISGSCKLWPEEMSSDGDLPITGWLLDQALLAACLFEAELYKNEGGNGAKRADWEKELTNAIMLDRETAPRRLGHMGGQRRFTHRHGWYDGVDTYTNTDGTITTF